jgi:hypothetical protein
MLDICASVRENPHEKPIFRRVRCLDSRANRLLIFTFAFGLY